MGRLGVSSQLHRKGGNLYAGMRGMFEGDLEAGTMHMKPMHSFMCIEVVFSPDRRRLDQLPLPSRSAVLSVVAAYLPYYAPQVQPWRLSECGS